MTKKILVVDDSLQLRNLLQSYLTQESFSIVTAGNGQEALYVARHEKPDMIILDLMMPEMGGYEFLRIYGRESSTPVIILTARVEENDKVIGLELGADDYITKPFGLRELTARIHAVFRRIEKSTPAQDTLKVDNITLDYSSRLVLVDGKTVDLTPSEFDLLAALMSAPGRVFSRLDLLDKLQGAAYEGYERSIDVHIRNLRMKIEPDPSSPQYIETVYGSGYRFHAQP
jgi:DNA-binding response OmpR family regulator